jgi:hypothetical protein
VSDILDDLQHACRAVVDAPYRPEPYIGSPVQVEAIRDVQAGRAKAELLGDSLVTVVVYPDGRRVRL